MDEDLYDEFGNYVGPDLVADENAEDDEEAPPGVWQLSEPGPDYSESKFVENDDDEDELLERAYANGDEPMADGGNAIVLAEDKRYYPTADEVFGEHTETLVQEEDAQPITEPIIAPPRQKTMEVLEKPGDTPPTVYNHQYLIDGVLSKPELIRNVAIIGHLHHGKTSLCDLLIEGTHQVDWKSNDVRYTDTRKDERDRGISIKATPFTVLLPDAKGKSYGFNFIDTPGHLNFFDESAAAIRLSDGVLLVVDALEGVMMGTEQLIQYALRERQAITLVLTKIDRLSLEVKLPPPDAYFKIRDTIQCINSIIEECPGVDEKVRQAAVVSPDKGNVCFSSASQGWICSLNHLASIYLADNPGLVMPPEVLARRLWGDIYFDSTSRMFTKRPRPGLVRSFVQFVLEPIYKLQSAVVGDDPIDLLAKMKQLGIARRLTKSELRKDVGPLLKTCMGAFFGHDLSGLASMLVHFVPPPSTGNQSKIDNLYTGTLDSAVARVMSSCGGEDASDLVILVSKLLPSTDCEYFYALGRIISGVANVGDSVRVLGDSFDPDIDDEDQSLASISAIYLPMARYKTYTSSAVAGQVVLLEGVASSISKGATIVAENCDESVSVFLPLSSSLSSGITTGVVKVAVEPLRPSELPKMLDGLRKCNQSYTALQTKVEESGEHVIFGPGELYMDCVLHDLRTVFAEIEIKISDPCVPFCETISETSSLQCFAETPNKKNKLTCIAEPLEDGLAEDLEAGVARSFMKSAAGAREVGHFLKGKYEWDALAVKSLWGFGPDPSTGPNCLLDDVLPGGETNKSVLKLCRSSIVQGFQWAVREGPLCDEPVRGLRCRLLDAAISSDPLSRNGAQMIPTARRVTYSSFLTGSPRLMEPCFAFEVICPPDSVSVVFALVGRRRGQVLEEVPKAGTPMTVVKGELPVLDSFGFETDLRTFTQGQAYCDQVFSHWSVMPGDPLDKAASLSLRPLEPAPNHALARECMLKTRRRKGMSEDIGIAKFFDDDALVAQLVERNGGM